jgi:hypothetical protein
VVTGALIRKTAMAALASLAIPAVSIGIPLWLCATARAQQGVLRNRLNTLRTVIGNYTYDKGNAPLSWQDLVREGYLRADPGNNYSTEWRIVMREAEPPEPQPGIWDAPGGSERPASAEAPAIRPGRRPVLVAQAALARVP